MEIFFSFNQSCLAGRRTLFLQKAVIIAGREVHSLKRLAKRDAGAVAFGNLELMWVD